MINCLNIFQSNLHLQIYPIKLLSKIEVEKFLSLEIELYVVI